MDYFAGRVDPRRAAELGLPVKRDAVVAAKEERRGLLASIRELLG